MQGLASAKPNFRPVRDTNSPTLSNTYARRMSYGLGTPGLTASNYILNIVELQNTVTSISGQSPVSVLSNQVAQIQQMVNTQTKQVSADILSAYTPNGTIQVISPLNLSTGTLTVSGGTSSFGTASTSLTIADGGLSFLQNGSVSTFTILSSGNAIFTSTVTAANFITSSDKRLKTNIHVITDYETILSSINGVYYRWKEGGDHDVGLIAQEVANLLPEAVVTNNHGFLGVAYHKLIPVLIEAVKSLQLRVSTLEGLEDSHALQRRHGAL